jgi:hypothetical protein
MQPIGNCWLTLAHRVLKVLKVFKAIRVQRVQRVLKAHKEYKVLKDPLALKDPLVLKERRGVRVLRALLERMVLEFPLVELFIKR